MLCATMLTCLLLLESRALYSPATLLGAPAVLWLGGWRTEQDVGPDRIYRMDKSGEPTLVFARDDAHVNDPSLVRPPGPGRQGWVFMYYTGIRNDDAKAQAWDRHFIGLASSVDDGRSFFDHGPIAPGWSPGAVVVGEEIWIYYHDHEARPWRIRLDGNGWMQKGAAERVTGTGPITNLDVSRLGPAFILVANTPDLRAVAAGASWDGLAFGMMQETPARGGYLLTPHLGADGILYSARTDDYLTGPYELVANVGWE